MNRVYAAPIGTQEWHQVGTLTTPFEMDPEPYDDITNLGDTLIRARTLSATGTTTFTPRGLNLLTGGHGPLDPVPYVAMSIRDTRSTRPAAPTKRRGLTGKKYRQARRSYRRAVQAWNRVGRPTATVTTYFQKVKILSVGRGREATCQALANEHGTIGTTYVEGLAQ